MIQKNERCSYASDLSGSQRAIFEPLFPRAGNRSKWEKRELVDAGLYFVEVRHIDYTSNAKRCADSCRIAIQMWNNHTLSELETDFSDYSQRKCGEFY